MITIPYNWQPREYQKPFWNHMAGGGKRAAIVWHRRAGKDLTVLNWTVQSMFQRVGLYWHIAPTYKQARKIVWNGFTSEGRRFIDHIPPELIVKKREDEMKVEVRGGSIWQAVGSDDIDSLVGSNPIGVVFSEWSLQNPKSWDLIRPILNENGGWAVFVYTMRGKNHGYDLLKAAQADPDWYAEVLTVEDTRKPLLGTDGRPTRDEFNKKISIPVISPEAIDQDRRNGMSEELIQQEYWCSPDAPLVGSYYADQMNKVNEEKRIGSFPYLPEHPVYTAWDIGRADATSIWFFQVIRDEFRFLEYYESVGNVMEDDVKAVLDKPYVYAKHFGPHDLKQRHKESKENCFEVARRLGLKFHVLPKTSSVINDIQAVRRIMPRCVFHRTKTNQGIECLRQYSKKWNENKMCFEDKPKHDWTSHGADAMRYAAMGIKTLVRPTAQPVTGVTAYNLHRHQPTHAETQYSMYRRDTSS